MPIPQVFLVRKDGRIETGGTEVVADGTYASPTSITIKNGLITAIS